MISGTLFTLVLVYGPTNSGHVPCFVIANVWGVVAQGDYRSFSLGVLAGDQEELGKISTSVRVSRPALARPK